MEEIYMNTRPSKPPKPTQERNQTGLGSSEKRFRGGVVLGLGLLSFFSLAGLICLGFFHYVSIQQHSAALSAVHANMTELLLGNDGKFSSLAEERDLLNASLIEVTKELKRQKLCPPGWRIFQSACYFLSAESKSWEDGKKDCNNRGSDLVVIKTVNEQEFLSSFTEGGTMAWIGLTDKVKEGTWVWIDGAPLSLKYWKETQPDNGGGQVGEEDCAHIIIGKEKMNWNDLPCGTKLNWICEKRV